MTRHSSHIGKASETSFLGSDVTVVLTKNGSGTMEELQQTNNYYPYGGLMANSTGWTGQRYKYNGKEFDRMHGLDWYDYGARWMDASIGRWHSMDPLAEKYYDVSPYVYCANNPVKFIDPDGRDIHVTGYNVSGAISSLSDAAGKGLKLDYNEESKLLCYTIIDKKLLNDNAKNIINVIDNCDIDVELRTIDTNKYTNLAVIGGSYFGASFQDGTAKAVNVVNPEVLSKMDAFSPRGTSMMHELSESYNGALDALENKKSYPASFCAGTNYEKAHNSATPQPDLRYYEVDKDGNMTLDHNTAIGQRIYVTDGIKTSTVIDWNYEKYGKIE